MVGEGERVAGSNPSALPNTLRAEMQGAGFRVQGLQGAECKGCRVQGLQYDTTIAAVSVPSSSLGSASQNEGLS